MVWFCGMPLLKFIFFCGLIRIISGHVHFCIFTRHLEFSPVGGKAKSFLLFFWKCGNLCFRQHIAHASVLKAYLMFIAAASALTVIQINATLQLPLICCPLPGCVFLRGNPNSAHRCVGHSHHSRSGSQLLLLYPPQPLLTSCAYTHRHCQEQALRNRLKEKNSLVKYSFLVACLMFLFAGEISFAKSDHRLVLFLDQHWQVRFVQPSTFPVCGVIQTITSCRATPPGTCLLRSPCCSHLSSTLNLLSRKATLVYLSRYTT